MFVFIAPLWLEIKRERRGYYRARGPQTGFFSSHFPGLEVYTCKHNVWGINMLGDIFLVKHETDPPMQWRT